MTRRRTLTYVCLCQKLLYVTGWIRLVYLHWEPKKGSNFTLFFSPFSITVTASDLSTHCCIIISSLLLLLAAAASYHVICLLAVRQLSSGCPLTTCLSFLSFTTCMRQSLANTAPLQLLGNSTRIYLPAAIFPFASSALATETDKAFCILSIFYKSGQEIAEQIKKSKHGNFKMQPNEASSMLQQQNIKVIMSKLWQIYNDP